MKRKLKIIGAALMVVVVIATAFCLLFPEKAEAAYYRGTNYFLNKQVLGASGYWTKMRVGTGSTSGHSYGTDDLYVEGDVEVDGVLYADGGIVGGSTSGNVQLLDSETLDIGTGDDLSFISNGTSAYTYTGTTNSKWYIGTVATGAHVNLDLQISGSTTANYALWDASGNELSFVNTTLDVEAGNLQIANAAVTSTAAELNVLDTFSGDVDDLEYAKDLYDTGVTDTEFDTALDGITSTAAELNQLDGNIFETELNINAVTVAIVEGDNEDDYEMTFTIGEPLSDKTINFPAQSGYAMLSTAALHDSGSVSAHTANTLIFEGATSDAYESVIFAIDPTMDNTLSISDGSTGTIFVSTLGTNAPDVANSVWGASNAVVWEGTADDYETSLEAVDPTMDNTISIPDVADGAIVLSSMITEIDIDAAAASTKWVVTDTTNWSVDVGGSNGRGGGNVLEFKTDNTVDDELRLDYGSTLDISDYSYIGFWMRDDGGDLVADEFDMELRSDATTALTGCGDLDIPAMDDDDWTWVEFDISGCSDLDTFRWVAIEADTNITANTAIDIQGFIAYKMSNGNGPPRGRLEYYPVSSGTVTQGEIVCAPEIPSMDQGVETCDANDYAPMGIAVTTSTTYVVIQTSGIAVLETSAAVADNAPVDATAATTIDDAGSAENEFGYAMEAAVDANDFIYVRLQF